MLRSCGLWPAARLPATCASAHAGGSGSTPSFLSSTRPFTAASRNTRPRASNHARTRTNNRPLSPAPDLPAPQLNHKYRPRSAVQRTGHSRSRTTASSAGVDTLPGRVDAGGGSSVVATFDADERSRAESRLIRHLLDQVQALLLGQAADHAEHHGLGPQLQAHPPLQRGLGQRGGRAIPLFLVGGGAVDHVRRMHDDMFGTNAGLGERFLISREPVGLHADLVVVELRDRTEDLQGLHIPFAGATRRHGDATGIDAVCAKQ